uniref:Uncharacterized protein n=1 Tax=Oryza nivara TaxID=4536 RepID=A0A0E0IX01_ORYNI
MFVMLGHNVEVAVMWVAEEYCWQCNKRYDERDNGIEKEEALRHGRMCATALDHGSNTGERCDAFCSERMREDAPWWKEACIGVGGARLRHQGSSGVGEARGTRGFHFAVVQNELVGDDDVDGRGYSEEVTR